MERFTDLTQEATSDRNAPPVSYHLRELAERHEANRARLGWIETWWGRIVELVNYFDELANLHSLGAITLRQPPHGK